MSDALRRGIRTFLQAFIGTLLSMFGLVYLTPGVLPDAAILQRILIAASVAGLIALLSWLQNFLEDRGSIGPIQIPSYGKSPASVGANPVPDPAQQIEPH